MVKFELDHDLIRRHRGFSKHMNYLVHFLVAGDDDELRLGKPRNHTERSARRRSRNCPTFVMPTAS